MPLNSIIARRWEDVLEGPLTASQLFPSTGGLMIAGARPFSGLGEILIVPEPLRSPAPSIVIAVSKLVGSPCADDNSGNKNSTPFSLGLNVGSGADAVP